MRHFCFLLITIFVVNTGQLFAKEPGWSNTVIATGEYRDKIRSTPIEKRPYRPFHVYGNTVRRLHYRGTVIPAPRDLAPIGGTLLRVFRRRG